MKRNKAKDLFRNDKDAYGKPRAIMAKVDMIYDEFEKDLNYYKESSLDMARRAKICMIILNEPEDSEPYKIVQKYLDDNRQK